MTYIFYIFAALKLTQKKLYSSLDILFNVACVFSIYLTLQRGVTGTARMLHALTHLSISRQVREQM